MRSQDVVILLKLISLQTQEAMCPNDPRWNFESDGANSMRGLQAQLGISKTEISASIHRSLAAGLAIKDRRSGRPKPNRRYLHGFIVHGLRFVFPARPGAITRGIPTAFAAPMLKGRLLLGSDDSCVWPASDGQINGQCVHPLFRSVPDAARKDELLYEYLALIDAIRLGGPREFRVAAETLSERLLKR
ncbi:MAG: hypothetical protein FWD68_12030 [Alphaproteobacteria bacterium]|nr:hypothetical protein [Alphaproteobacteria bacterium]